MINHFFAEPGINKIPKAWVFNYMSMDNFIVACCLCSSGMFLIGVWAFLSPKRELTRKFYITTISIVLLISGGVMFIPNTEKKTGTFRINIGSTTAGQKRYRLEQLTDQSDWIIVQEYTHQKDAVVALDSCKSNQWKSEKIIY